MGRPGDREPGGIWQRDGKQALAVACATLAVELGAYAGAMAAGANQRDATLAALATATVWVALAAGAMAAGARDALGALLRGGVVADASAVTLLALWLAGPYLTFVAVVKVYCLLACMALAGAAAAHLPARPAGRSAAAIVAAIAFLALLTTPLWCGGLLTAMEGSARETAVRWAVAVNPFYGVTAAVVERTGFVWHYGAVMYHLTPIGDYAAPPPMPWYASAWRVALVAVLLALAKLAIARRRARHQPLLLR